MADMATASADNRGRSREAAARSNRRLTLPALAIITVFGVLPLGLILIYSFLEAGAYGGVVWKFSPDAYVNFLFQRDIFDGTLQFSPDYLLIYLRSFLFALGRPPRSACCSAIRRPISWRRDRRRSATCGCC